MRRIVATGLLATLLSMVGCEPDDAVATEHHSMPNEPKANEITVKDSRDDTPEFKRTYAAQLPSTRNIKLEVVARTSHILKYTTYSGALTQGDGRSVFFDPERPAEKILDRELVPLVEEYCDAIIAEDKAWRAVPQPSFTDTNGVTWVRR